MCGIVAIAHRDLRAPVGEDALRGMVRTLVHRGPEDEGLLVRPWRRARLPPAVVHGHPRRPAAVHQRSRRRPRRRQRRDLQLSRSCAPNSRRCGHRFRSGSDIEAVAPRVRGVGLRRVLAPARHVRDRALRRAHAGAGRGAGSRRREAALLRRYAAGAVPRLRGQGAAGASRGVARVRPAGAGPVPDVRVRHRAADAVLADPHACRLRTTSCTATARCRWRATGTSADTPVRAWTEADAAARRARGAGHGRRSADDVGRAARRVPVGRHRLERDRGVHGRRGQASRRHGHELQHGLPRPELQRTPVRARDCDALRPHARRGRGHGRRRRAVRPTRRAPRRAVRGRVAVSDVPGVAAGAPARQGRAGGRWRRRAVRRLRRVRGAGAGGATLARHARRRLAARRPRRADWCRPRSRRRARSTRSSASCPGVTVEHGRPRALSLDDVHGRAVAPPALHADDARGLARW